MGREVLVDQRLLAGGRLGGTAQVHQSGLAVGQLVVDQEGLLQLADVLLTVLQRQQSAVDLGVDELQVFEGVLPADEQVEEGLGELLLDVDALVDGLAHEAAGELVLEGVGREGVGEGVAEGGFEEEAELLAEGRPAWGGEYLRTRLMNSLMMPPPSTPSSSRPCSLKKMILYLRRRSRCMQLWKASRNSLPRRTAMISSSGTSSSRNRLRSCCVLSLFTASRNLANRD